MSQARRRTSRLQLIPLSDEHLDHEAELDADPEVMRYLGNGRAQTREEIEVLHRQRPQAPGMARQLPRTSAVRATAAAAASR
jgi:hypothetical protein